MAAAVSTLNELMAALDAGERDIQVTTTVVSPHAISLPAGTRLSGGGHSVVLSFASGGLCLGPDTTVEGLTVVAPAADRAIQLLAGYRDLGTIVLRDLIVSGQVAMIARLGTMSGRIEADNVHVATCDARAHNEQPQKYGVNVLQGAFTVYNFNSDPNSRLTATLTGISVGRPQAPVLGSGVFVSGFSDTGGRIDVDTLTCGSVHSTGVLTFGTADFITGGVFVLAGAHVAELECTAECETYGVNDMVLDNWGTVDSWICRGPIRSWGPSGIGFVNFGTVDTFVAQDVVETHGLGARGFNQYDGTVSDIRFRSITTFGDGSIGIQVSKPVGRIAIDTDLVTHGGQGPSLVKGVIMDLPAIGFSVKPGGSVEKLEVAGSIVTHGEQITAFSVEAGAVEEMNIGGSVRAEGANALSVEKLEGGRAPID